MDALAVEALDEIDEDAPLLRGFSPDSLQNAAGEGCTPIENDGSHALTQDRTPTYIIL